MLCELKRKKYFLLLCCESLNRTQSLEDIYNVLPFRPPYNAQCIIVVSLFDGPTKVAFAVYRLFMFCHVSFNTFVDIKRWGDELFALLCFSLDNSAMLAENLRMRFNERTIATQQRVRDLMDQSGRETWNCDQEPNEYRHKGRIMRRAQT